jgi:excinuclease ABC subunit C
MLAMDPPKRIESFDISNISGTDMVASMVVFEDGKPKKSEYKRFKIEDLPGQDDYAAMRQVILRRFTHFKAGDKGFDQAPDLLLIDGGVAHAAAATGVLADLELQIRTMGMVKDDRHRTRALVTPEGLEIRIDAQQAVFSLIGNIQEETHNFAISYHRKLRSKRLRGSALDGIAGIGPKRKEEMLKAFRSISAISDASIAELERYLPKNTALEVYRTFHPDTQ